MKLSIRHEEISRALKSYKKGALLRTFRTINKLHRSAIDFEKFFAQGMKETLKETWQSHVNVLTHLMDWMTKLLELYSGENGHEPSSSEKSTSQVEWNSYENSENMQEFATRSRTGYFNFQSLINPKLFIFNCVKYFIEIEVKIVEAKKLWNCRMNIFSIILDKRKKESLLYINCANLIRKMIFYA